MAHLVVTLVLVRRRSLSQIIYNVPLGSVSALWTPRTVMWDVMFLLICSGEKIHSQVKEDIENINKDLQQHELLVKFPQIRIKTHAA